MMIFAIFHGGDYNYDQWQAYPDVLDEDMRLMKLNCMTIGIFAWAALEPEEGYFDFSFLDKTVNDIYKNGGWVVLATPGGVHPAWLPHKYPEVLRVKEDSIKNTHGMHHNLCVTSPVYREKIAVINRYHQSYELFQRYRLSRSGKGSGRNCQRHLSGMERRCRGC